MKDEKRNKPEMHHIPPAAIRKSTSIMLVLFLVMGMALPVMATGTGGPLESIAKLDEIIFGIGRGFGIIVTGIAIFQFGLSFKSHDAMQRSTATMGIVGGLIIVFAKELINAII